MTDVEKAQVVVNYLGQYMDDMYEQQQMISRECLDQYFVAPKVHQAFDDQRAVLKALYNDALKQLEEAIVDQAEPDPE